MLVVWKVLAGLVAFSRAEADDVVMSSKGSFAREIGLGGLGGELEKKGYFLREKEQESSS